MVLAESVKFKHGLYKSCGKECFEGIMLEPCLLQPCFHVAGQGQAGLDPDHGGLLLEQPGDREVAPDAQDIYIYIYI